MGTRNKLGWPVTMCWMFITLKTNDSRSNTPLLIACASRIKSYCYSQRTEEIRTSIAIPASFFAGKKTRQRGGHTMRYEANQTLNHTCVWHNTRIGRAIQLGTAWRVPNSSRAFIKAQRRTGAACERVPWKLRRERGLQGATGGEGSSCTGSWAPWRPLRPRLQANSWAQRSELHEKHSEIWFSTGRKRLPPNEGRRNRVINVTVAPLTARSRVGLLGSKSTRSAQTTHCAEVLALLASDLNYK